MAVWSKFDKRAETGEDTRIHLGVQKAKQTLKNNGIPPHIHGRKCMNLLRHVLYKDEETLLEAKQHAVQSLSPIRGVATNRRLIIVYPSFWGLWTGYDLISPTTYAILPYKYIIGVSMSRGKMLSSLKVHTSGSVDTGSQVHDNSEVQGIITENAIIMTRLLEEIIEYIEDIREPDTHKHNQTLKNNLVDLQEAQKIIEEHGSKFIWIGIEPAAYISKLLGVPKETILVINPTNANSYTEEEATALDYCIIISYDGILSTHLSTLLKYKFGTDIYVLEGGIDKIIEDTRIARNYPNLYA